ncbi:hypothetical protein GCM10010339_55820 [Streptomyces alanosinicus]|uniref:Uncharacterized protein n=1 Tax=Streptomyces alanosinicus TaxID=68171 RepID=A0A918YLW8_9ACTN|nr:hypothetical protein GCM10010339_55820 [Streptomyces alanosinicus]
MLCTATSGVAAADSTIRRRRVAGAALSGGQLSTNARTAIRDFGLEPVCGEVTAACAGREPDWLGASSPTPRRKFRSGPSRTAGIGTAVLARARPCVRQIGP